MFLLIQKKNLIKEKIYDIKCFNFICNNSCLVEYFTKETYYISNFPVIGHIRYLFESIGQEIRQYWIAGNREKLLA